ncbi:A disintegrin and metalloproteinase with thrombospondin motifs 1 [Elysia marginata]|uniref:A disintegrin and metalloproteinase with thrombospondin motifs 1 n=1 Tax=Elysia marginata TaxID=1093978 RepID=A0AAV4HVM1_9GAST|nr:A disintegrin and metalloproteinase with thrombospondin motifs 1 [Elysia marginata]
MEKSFFIYICQTESDDDFIEDLISSGTFPGGDGLDAFRNWVQDPSNNIPNADHYMYMTGFDIRGATGIAFLSRVCTASGVSINENDFTAGLATVAAHELGHSLSCDHDGGSCSATNHNIMTPIFSLPVTTANKGNPWRFSSCSIASIKAYLNGVSCTEPGNTGTTDALPAPTGNDRAGIALDRDNQCRHHLQDSSSSYCSSVQTDNGGEEGLCSGMYCDETSTDFCVVVLPLEHTACGTGKWCRTGLCVEEGVEPTNPPTQPTGPETIFDCVPFLLRLDFLGLLDCFRNYGGNDSKMDYYTGSYDGTFSTMDYYTGSYGGNGSTKDYYTGSYVASDSTVSSYSGITASSSGSLTTV